MSKKGLLAYCSSHQARTAFRLQERASFNDFSMSLTDNTAQTCFGVYLPYRFSRYKGKNFRLVNTPTKLSELDCDSIHKCHRFFKVLTSKPSNCRLARTSKGATYPAIGKDCRVDFTVTLNERQKLQRRQSKRSKFCMPETRISAPSRAAMLVAEICKVSRHAKA